MASTTCTGHVSVIVAPPITPEDDHDAVLDAMIAITIEAGADTLVLDLHARTRPAAMEIATVMRYAARCVAEHVTAAIMHATPTLASAIQRTRLTDLVSPIVTVDDVLHANTDPPLEQNRRPGTLSVVYVTAGPEPSVEWLPWQQPQPPRSTRSSGSGEER